MTPSGRRLLFLLFFLSGFSGLVYQVVWLRLALASFGVITPIISVVISVFMLGLGIGAWAGGKVIGWLTRRTGLSAVLFYAVAEFLIGLGAFAVPWMFKVGEQLLLRTGQGNSFHYLALSAVMVAVSLLPWCVCMGATFPFMLGYVRERDPSNAQSFSHLYLANVLGAMSGALLTAVVLVEVLGFRQTLWVAAAGNFVIAGISAWLGVGSRPIAPSLAGVAVVAGAAPVVTARGRFITWILFATGFVAMAMEVVWVRAFTPVLTTQVYAFALVLCVYLGATFLGTARYRADVRRHTVQPTAQLLAVLSSAALLPVLLNDNRLARASLYGVIDPGSALLLLLSLVPFCALLGYLTPALVDEYAGGSPAAAGRAYAVNVAGCILGPLVAGYLILPRLQERYALILLALPLLFFHWRAARSLGAKPNRVSKIAVGALLALAALCSRSHEDYLVGSEKHSLVRRDYAASVIAYGEGRERRLLVNGVGMTALTPCTKFMVDLPLAFHRGPPESVLVICFGMGTTFRTAVSWGIPATAVELVPGVTETFGFYHADAAEVAARANGRIVIDDGRRYLNRTTEKFDVVVADPPPPVEAAGSSLLYSEEFYAAVKRRLKPNGILQVWFPGRAASANGQAVLGSLRRAFTHVRGFGSIDGVGIHLLASMEPMDELNAAALVARLPAAARRDLLEWSSTTNLVEYMNAVVAAEFPIPGTAAQNPDRRITDDHPYNEYYLLRRWGLWR